MQNEIVETKPTGWQRFKDWSSCFLDDVKNLLFMFFLGICNILAWVVVLAIMDSVSFWLACIIFLIAAIIQAVAIFSD